MNIFDACEQISDNLRQRGLVCNMCRIPDDARLDVYLIAVNRAVYIVMIGSDTYWHEAYVFSQTHCDISTAAGLQQFVECCFGCELEGEVLKTFALVHNMMEQTANKCAEICDFVATTTASTN